MLTVRSHPYNKLETQRWYVPGARHGVEGGDHAVGEGEAAGFAEWAANLAGRVN